MVDGILSSSFPFRILLSPMWVFVVDVVSIPHSRSLREDVPSSRLEPHCGVHLHVLQGEAH